MLEELVRNALDAMIVTEARPVDPPGPRIVFVNAAVTQISGYTREELIGATPRIFQGPLTDRAALDRIRQAIQEYRPITEELVNYRKDGSPFFVQMQLMPVAADPEQEFSHFVCIQRDVTLQRQAELTLRASEQQMRRMVENLPLGAVFCDGTNLIANRASERITGYQRTELQSVQQWFQILYREEWQSIYQLYLADRLAGFPQPRIVTLYTKKGEPRRVEFAAYSEGDKEIWIFRDVTETERMQRLMIQTERTARIGGWEMVLPSQQVYWSDEVYRLHEVDPETFIPTYERVLSFYDSQTQNYLLSMVQHSLETGDPFEVELELRTAKGRLVWIRSVGQVDRVDGCVTRLYGSVAR
ncbi:MAG: PAS domain-containing protein, partial [Gemmataceae bacterium]